MKKGIFALLIIFVICAGVKTSACRKKQSILKGPDRYMDIDSIEPGMKGFGVSVFRGSECENFDVEVIGVVRDWYPDSDIILVEVHNDYIDESGIIAGMSGSPIYINGKLIGALAYGWSFQKKPIAGVTPINEMLVTDKVELSRSSGIGFNTGQHAGKDSTGSRLVPLSIPLTVSGASPEFKQFIQDELNERMGSDMFIAAGGGASGSGKRIPGDLKEGSAVAVKLIEGDFDIAAVGTVSCVTDKTVYAFGHPFNAEGTISLPMAKAWIHTVIPSLYRSFKLSSTGETVGAVNYDFNHGIIGTMGSVPNMVELEANVLNKDTDTSEDYSFKIAHGRNWTPFMTFLALNYCINGSSIIGTDLSVWVKTTIKPKGFDTITGRNFFTTPGKPGFDAGYSVSGKLGYLMDNELKPLDIESVGMDIKVSGGRQYKVVERFIKDRTEVAPGETVNLTVFMEKYGMPDTRGNIHLTVPEDIPEGIVRVDIYNGIYTVGQDLQRAPGLGRPETIQQAVELLNDPYDANTMVIDFNTTNKGVVVKGKEYQDIPESILDIYKSLSAEVSEPTGWKLFKREVRKRKEVIMCNISLTLNISDYSN